MLTGFMAAEGTAGLGLFPAHYTAFFNKAEYSAKLKRFSTPQMTNACQRTMIHHYRMLGRVVARAVHRDGESDKLRAPQAVALGNAFTALSHCFSICKAEY